MASLDRAPIGGAAGSLYEPREDQTNGQRADAVVSEAAVLPPTASRVGFGCAGLMQCVSVRQRQRLLAEAFEQGIRHFDVARMYGLGAAERELGQFARHHRAEIVIATKFGIEPTASLGRLGRLQAPARAAVARLPALRRALKRRAGAFHQPRDYSVSTARASLETSLRELRTDHVDVLFVHDPAPDDPIDVAALVEALEDMRRAGLVRAWGFAGEPEPCIELSRSVGVPTVLQVRDDIFGDGAPTVLRGRDDIFGDGAPTILRGRDDIGGTPLSTSSSQPTITFGILAAALERIRGHVCASDRRRARWQRAIGVDCGRAEVLSSLLVQDALDRNPAGTVLFSTTRVERIEIATAAADARLREPDSAPLHAFRELVRSELASPPVRSGLTSPAPARG